MTMETHDGATAGAVAQEIAYRLVRAFKDAPEETAGVAQGILTIRETKLSDAIAAALAAVREEVREAVEGVKIAVAPYIRAAEKYHDVACESEYVAETGALSECQCDARKRALVDALAALDRAARRAGADAR